MSLPTLCLVCTPNLYKNGEVKRILVICTVRSSGAHHHSMCRFMYTLALPLFSEEAGAVTPGAQRLLLRHLAAHGHDLHAVA